MIEYDPYSVSMDGDCELLIQNGTTAYFPPVIEDIQWSLERSGAAGKLSFKVISSNGLKIAEGNPVRFKYKKKNIFYGFIFERKINEEGIMSITAYDQLRYFKNKATYVYSVKTYSWLVKKIAKDFGLKCGTIQDTKYKIPSRIEDNKTLFDICGNASDLTITNRREMYILYDDFGKLALKNISKLKVNIIIDEETGQSYEFTSSIDGETYNEIKLYYDNESTGKRDTYIAKSTANINKWGLLRYYDKLEDGENGKTKVKQLLSYYNAPIKKLSVKKAIGDVRVRAGSLVVLSMRLDRKDYLSYMLVDSVKHKFSENEHWMDLTLIGGEINGS